MTDITKVEIKFAADRMLGRLAKWLRVIGQDVIYEMAAPVGARFDSRRAQRRSFDPDPRPWLKEKQPPHILIASDHFQEQLRQVVTECRLSLGAGYLFSRCLQCNSALQARAKESIETAVPPFVFASQEKFFWCPQCRRIYWPATHHQKMVEELQRLELP